MTVRSGIVPAHSDQFVDDGGRGFSSAHPSYELWVSDDEEGSFLQGGVGGYTQTCYEIIAVER